jgi:hypothetical protein
MVNSKIRIFRLHNNGGSQGLIRCNLAGKRLVSENLIRCNLAGKRLVSEKMWEKLYVRRVMDFMTRHGKKGCY